MSIENMNEMTYCPECDWEGQRKWTNEDYCPENNDWLDTCPDCGEFVETV